MKPSNAPAACPRLFDESSGPRQCALLKCPLHLRAPSTRGAGSSARRVRLAVLVDDTCAVDLAERSRASGQQLTLDEIAIVLGISHQAASQLLRSGLRKLRIAMRVRAKAG